MKALVQIFKADKVKVAKEIFDQASQIAADCGGRLTLNRRYLISNDHLREIWANNYSYSSIETIIKSLENRTATSSEAAATLTKLFESSVNGDSLEKIIETFGRFIDGFNNDEKLENLQIEIKLSNEEKKISNLEISLESYPKLNRLSRIIKIIPASNASSERAFSKLVLILRDRRTTMNQDRLSNLMTISSNFNDVPSIEEVLQRFLETDPRRINIFI